MKHPDTNNRAPKSSHPGRISPAFAGASKKILKRPGPTVSKERAQAAPPKTNPTPHGRKMPARVLAFILCPAWYVKEDGRVYRSKPGIDEYLGKADLSSGRVYEERLGPDREIGHVDLKSGRVYLRQFGPEEYVGTVDGNGRMHRHVPMAPNEYSEPPAGRVISRRLVSSRVTGV